MTPTPDTGDLRTDLLTGIGTVVEGLTGPDLGHVLVPFVAEIFDARRASTESTLRAAIERGEVGPDIDMTFVLDVLAAPAYFRRLFGHAPLDRRLIEQTVDLLLAAIRTDRD